jgi:hypothetical protein
MEMEGESSLRKRKSKATLLKADSDSNFHLVADGFLPKFHAWHEQTLC